VIKKSAGQKIVSTIGFTLIELLLVIAIIAICVTIAIVWSLRGVREATSAKAKAELRAIAQAAQLYSYDNKGVFPADRNRDLPPGLEKYVTAGGKWPKAAWQGSVYDWDAWEDPVTKEKIYQVSIRFCPYGEPDECKFPNEPWAKNFDYYSSVYYCISGPCRSHIDKPKDHPGYCVNCK
jgi:prepilin-type N-terminal cleavage/methylation domain-containing protein